MPRVTDREELTNVLVRQLVIETIAEEQEAYDTLINNSPSTSSSESSETSSSSDSDSMDDVEHAFSPGTLLTEALQRLHSTRYLNRRVDLPKTDANLRLVLDIYMDHHPVEFRSFLRVTPACFRALLEAIQDDEIFHNNSQNDQLPVQEQLAIALYRFGHFGNAASLGKVGHWAGIGHGTADKVMKRILVAICRGPFRRGVMRWPSADEKEAAQVWVEQNSCPAWRKGWIMVDGTLVPLFMRPGFYGNTWFDRKSNYSMNVQLVSTPNLRIIDYGVGLPGSQHDATAWAETRVYKEHDTLLEHGEFIWGDSAYPLSRWCQAPYKKPEKDTRENTNYNYHVSKVRIRSEHCVGFLKGRWSSLRGLRVSIRNATGIQFAALWITACIVLHTFAMDHESGMELTADFLYQEGMQLMREEAADRARRKEQEEAYAAEDERVRAARRDLELLEGRLFREELKKNLFMYIN